MKYLHIMLIKIIYEEFKHSPFAKEHQTVIRFFLDCPVLWVGVHSLVLKFAVLKQFH